MFSPVAGPSRIPDVPRPTKQPRRTEAGSTLAGMQPGPGLKALPDDVLLLIIGLIDVEDIIALRLVRLLLYDGDVPQLNESSLL